ncbi:MAG: phosphodiester glycosidase family protein [Myxococcota bacterium]
MLPRGSSPFTARRGARLLARLTALSLATLSASAAAQERPRPPVQTTDLWTELEAGVRYLRRSTSAPAVIHVLDVDLDTEGLDLDATPHRERWGSVRELARAADHGYAINGGFWESMATPGGLQVGEGEAWPNSVDDERYGILGVRRERGRLRAFVEAPERVRESPDGLHAALSGRPLLVARGEVATEAIDASTSANRLQPRTAVGVARRGRRLLLAVTDGRQDHSRGMTLYQLARTLQELGAQDALNLDGGGSSTLFIERLGGVVNAPSGSRWEHALGLGPERLQGEVLQRRRRRGKTQVYVRGVEREVMNHLGLRTAGTRGVTPPPAVHDPEAPAAWVLPPRPPRLRTGRWVETAAQAGPWLGLGLLTVLVYGWRRRKAERRRFANERRHRPGAASAP